MQYTKFRTHTTNIASKATSLTYTILWTFNSKSAEPYIKAFKCYVRPVLEYSTVLWNPCTLTEIRCVEKVQRLFTRNLLKKLNIKYNSYNDRLKQLNLESLEMRRLQYDLIMIYKILNNLIDLNFDQFFRLMKTRYNLRHHRFALQNPSLAKTSILRNMFKYRVINAWNSLSDTAVSSKSLDIFKTSLKSENLERFIFIEQ